MINALSVPIVQITICICIQLVESRLPPTSPGGRVWPPSLAAPLRSHPIYLQVHSPAMAMPARSEASQRIRDTIAKQFALSDAQLHAITQQFVDDFNHGLSKYNEPMAMMCAFSCFFCVAVVVLKAKHSPTFVTGPPPDGSEKGWADPSASQPITS